MMKLADNFKKYEWWIVIRVILLFIVLFAAAYSILNRNYFYLVFLVPVIIYQVYEFIQFQRKAHNELNQFVEAVHYRDFVEKVESFS